MKAPLSVAIITGNESKMLAACLESVSFADDIVVVDSESTDQTVDIARRFNCRVFVEPWKGFGRQKMSAVEKCRHDWVLIVDADERIPEETKEAIVKAIQGADTADGYSFFRKAFFNGKWIKHCGWWPDEIVRLFRKEKGRVTDRAVHESIEVMGSVRRLSGPILHYPAEDTDALLKKISAYSTLGARELAKSGQKATASKAFTHALTSFVKSYFIKKGFLDGREGFIISITGSVTTFYKYIKLMELIDRDRG
ncbi:MAG: hypothetical protein C0402_14465 [Thermodesulfovibrio sp.]|nr:hypothetical protein [Thermodesulfovibrio sp.]